MPKETTGGRSQEDPSGKEKSVDYSRLVERAGEVLDAHFPIVGLDDGIISFGKIPFDHKDIIIAKAVSLREQDKRKTDYTYFVQADAYLRLKEDLVKRDSEGRVTARTISLKIAYTSDTVKRSHGSRRAMNLREIEENMAVMKKTPKGYSAYVPGKPLDGKALETLLALLESMDKAYMEMEVQIGVVPGLFQDAEKLLETYASNKDPREGIIGIDEGGRTVSLEDLPSGELADAVKVNSKRIEKATPYIQTKHYSVRLVGGVEMDKAGNEVRRSVSLRAADPEFAARKMLKEGKNISNLKDYEMPITILSKTQDGYFASDPVKLALNSEELNKVRESLQEIEQGLIEGAKKFPKS